MTLKTATLTAAAAITAVVTLSLPASANEAWDRVDRNSKSFQNACSMLDDSKRRPKMDGLLTKLLLMCDRAEELGRVKPKYAKLLQNRIPGTDALVNDPSGDTGSSQTQNETSIARSATTGTLCSGFNDSYSGVVQNAGFTGFARSTDSGATFTDGGPVGSRSFGDPSMIWNAADGNFYLAALDTDGLGYWRSTDDCQTFQFLANSHVGSSDDKELLAVDNNPTSSTFGRVHMVWTDFTDSRIKATYTDNGTAWSTPVAISAAGADVQGAWPIVGSDGTVYVAWVRWNPYFSGPTDIEIVRSDDGGDSYTQVTNPLSGAVNPYDASATNNCGRPALNGNLRYLASPQIAVTPNGDLHVVYSYDDDGRNNGDVINVFYRRSQDLGATWGAELRLNDDTTLNDQYFPALSAGPTGRLVASWYDRRLDPANLAVDYYARVSDDGGSSWGPNVRISDESSPIYLDPNLANCYHGDYDQSIQTASEAFIQWADDRAVRSGHNDPDTYLDRNVFAPDFFLSTPSASLQLCAPDPAVYTIDVGQALGFSDPVTLSVSGAPAGTSTVFGNNPVIPGNATTLTVGNTAAASAGDYALQVDGVANSETRSTTLALSLSTDIPGASTTVFPANGATDLALRPEFSWSPAADATGYSIEIATDAAFSNIVVAENVAGTTFTPAANLGPDTEHFWRVSANNYCGPGASSATASFTTSVLICNNPNLAIPDGDGNGVDDPSIVLASGTITDLDVTLDVTHTYVGDLKFTLTHNDTGTSVDIYDRPGNPATTFGCSGNDILATMDDEAATPVEDVCNTSGIAIEGTFGPPQPLSAFDGEDLGGTWTLNVSDNAGADLGTLNEWCLIPQLDSGGADSDGDGVDDSVDNCTNVSNANQIDADGDGIGNLCDADLNNDCLTNLVDLIEFKARFASSDPVADFNSDGTVNLVDLIRFKALFGAPPGPAAEPNGCSAN